MEKLKKEILKLVREYGVTQRAEQQKYDPDGWVKYSGPVWGANEYEAAVETLLDGWHILGAKGREFEKKFAPLLGKKDGILVNSGSSANLLMVKTAMDIYGWKKGHRVIVPAVSFPTTVAPIIQCGLEPVFVDSTLPNLNLDLAQVESLLHDDSKIVAIMFAHVLGNPPNMSYLEELADEFGVKILEDCCDALGSTYQGEPLGSFGDIATCSFFPAHHMTMGEGGFVAFKNASDRQIAASYRDWGRACWCNSMLPGDVTEKTACGNRLGKWLTSFPTTNFDHRYTFSKIGYNLKPLELQAAIGLAQLDRLKQLDGARKANHKVISEIFGQYPQYFYLTEATPFSDPCWFAYLINVREDAPFSRDELQRRFEENKIQTRAYFAGNILAHPAYHEYRTDREYPIADFVVTNSFFIGVFFDIMYEDLKRINQVLDDFIKEKA